jgi:hypothetical protein
MLSHDFGVLDGFLEGTVEIVGVLVVGIVPH